MVTTTKEGMSLEDAIKVLTAGTRGKEVEAEDWQKAIALGIQAMKRLRDFRNSWTKAILYRLRGEMK